MVGAGEPEEGGGGRLLAILREEGREAEKRFNGSLQRRLPARVSGPTLSA